MNRNQISLSLSFMVLVSLVLVGFSHRDRSEGALPPLGRRQYVLPPRSSYKPVIIKKIEHPIGARAMLDPVQPRAIEVPSPHLRPRPRPSPPPQAGQLRFRKLPVSGRLTQPRVDFTRETLPIERADEPIGQDFYPKVFEPAKDDSF